MFERSLTLCLLARNVISDVAVKLSQVKGLLKILEIAMLSTMRKLKSPKGHPCSAKFTWLQRSIPVMNASHQNWELLRKLGKHRDYKIWGEMNVWTCGLLEYKIFIRTWEKRRIRWRRIHLTKSWNVERWRMAKVTNYICCVGFFSCNMVTLTHVPVMIHNNSCCSYAGFLS